MWRLSLDETFTRLPDRRTGDILAARVAHHAKGVTVRLRFAELRPRGVQYFMASVRTGRGEEFRPLAGVRSGPRTRGGVAFLEDLVQESEIHCVRLRHVLDYDRNVLRLRVPRSCLGDPRLVRLSIVVETILGRPGSADAGYFRDNPQTRLATRPPFTRRLHRG